MTVPTKVLAVCRAVLPASVSTLVLVVVAAQLPAVAGVALVAAVVIETGLLRYGVGEGVASRVLHGARAPTDVEAAVLTPATVLLCRAALGPPLVRVRIQPHDLALVAQPWGCRTVVVPRGLVLAVHEGTVSHEQVAGSLVHAAGACRRGMTRRQPALALWCMPWLLLEGIVSTLAGALRSFPLLRLAWHARFVVASVAAAQAALGAHLWLAAVVAGLAASTYVQPALNRTWNRHVLAAGDGAVVAAGLGRPYAALLTHAGHGVGLERAARLTQGAPTEPPAVLVAAMRSHV